MSHSPESLQRLFEGPAELWSGKPLELTNHFNFLALQTRILAKKIGKNLNMKINKIITQPEKRQ